jgi:hypothetical protein
VHAPRDADGSQQHLDAAPQRALAVPARVEQADRDVWVLIERQMRSVVSLGVDVIKEEPDSDAAVGGPTISLTSKRPVRSASQM